jgi:putative membrane protein
MWWGPGGGGWVGWFFMAFMMMVFWGLLIVLVVWLVRTTRPFPGKDDGRDRSNALAILEERFARGEIDREEFEQRRAALQGH